MTYSSRSWLWYALYSAKNKKGGRRAAWSEERTKRTLAENPELTEIYEAAKALGEILADENAMGEEILARLAAYRKAKSDYEAKLKKARDELKGILGPRQEAVLVMRGTLD